MIAGRRQVLRWLGAGPLAALGCKIEPILEIGPSPAPRPFLFLDPPPQVPDQVEDPEDALEAALDEVLAVEAPSLEEALRQRDPGSSAAIDHLIARLQIHGLGPGGPDGEWTQPVGLRQVELPAEARPVVRARRVRRAGGDPLGEAIELGPHGVFRQRRAGRIEGLPLAPIRQVGEALPRELVAGRVALLRAPAGLDVASEAGIGQIDGLGALARESGAAGCLVLTERSEEELAPLRERWRHVLSAEAGGDEGLMIDGVLSSAGGELLRRAMEGARSWVLEAELGLTERVWTSRNVIARLGGQDFPDEAVVLVCAWDTPTAADGQLETMRLLASLAALAQLAEWLRRGAWLRRSIVGVFAVDAGLGAGQAAHARWAASAGLQVSSVVAIDRVEPDVVRVAASLSGPLDARVVALADRACEREGRSLQLAGALGLPWLAPYLKPELPVMTIGAGPSAGETPQGLRAGLRAEVRLVRDLLLALAENIGPPRG